MSSGPFEYEEVLKATKEYFAGDELVASTWINKYCLKDKDGRLFERTPADMHARLANEFARIEKEKYGEDFESWRAKYLDAMSRFSRIVPQGSPMSAIGNPFQIMSASNCVVVDSPEDSITGIMKSATELANLFKRRCGVGIDISTLRPDGMTVNNAAKTTSGAWSFADLFSYITRMVGQNSRRGALMITLDVHHPDVEKFATMKQDLTKVTGANVSVKLSDVFMQAVETNSLYEQRWPLTGEPKITKMVNARKVWDTITTCATKTAEPCIVFWDRIIKYSPTNSYSWARSISLNPCAEISLCAYDSCRLISINLTGYVKDAFGDNPKFDLSMFREDVKLATRMSDNLVDLEIELIDKIMLACDGAEKEMWSKLQSMGRRGRRVGIGTHALADMFAQLKIRYDSDDAIKLASIIYSNLRDCSYRESIELAKARGAFDGFSWELESSNEFIKELPDDIKDGMAKHGRRNIALLTNAPTGTVSMLSKVGNFNNFNSSSGIEPAWKIKYKRRRKGNPNDINFRTDFIDDVGDSWMEFDVLHSNFKNWLNANAITTTDAIPHYFVSSDQIDWQYRVKLQGEIQKFICHAISSTVNLPAGTPVSTVSAIYLNAWHNKLKGITVYVDGSRTGVLVGLSQSRPKEIKRQEAPKRPHELSCDIHRLTYKGKHWLAAVGKLGSEPYEMFACEDTGSIGKGAQHGVLIKKARGRYALMTDEGSIHNIAVPEFGWATRLISTSLRHGVPIDYIVEQLNKEGTVADLNRVLARVLKKYIKDGKVRTSATCPECGSSNLIWQEGCMSCGDCSYRKCG